MFFAFVFEFVFVFFIFIFRVASCAAHTVEPIDLLIPLSIKAVASNGEQGIDAPTVDPFTLRVVEHHLPVEVEVAHHSFSLLVISAFSPTRTFAITWLKKTMIFSAPCGRKTTRPLRACVQLETQKLTVFFYLKNFSYT